MLKNMTIDAIETAVILRLKFDSSNSFTINTSIYNMAEGDENDTNWYFFSRLLFKGVQNH